MTKSLLTCLTCWMAIASSPAFADQTLLKLSNSTLPPVTTVNGDGFLDQIAEEMFDRAGFELEVQRLPSARGLALANAGLLDGELARINIRTDLYPSLHQLPDPLIDVVFAGLYRQSSIDVKTLDDFMHFRVGYIRGWVIAETLFSGDENANATGSVNQLLDMLEAGRIDIAFMTVAPAHYLANSRGMGKLHVTDFRVSKDLFLYVHEKHVCKLPALARALKSMKDDGSHEAILNEYRLKYK